MRIAVWWKFDKTWHNAKLETKLTRTVLIITVQKFVTKSTLVFMEKVKNYSTCADQTRHQDRSFLLRPNGRTRNTQDCVSFQMRTRCLATANKRQNLESKQHKHKTYPFVLFYVLSFSEHWAILETKVIFQKKIRQKLKTDTVLRAKPRWKITIFVRILRSIQIFSENSFEICKHYLNVYYKKQYL